MPTLSEVQEHAADAEHQAFQRAYDALLDIAKDPITCRHFWDAGRDAMRAELARQEPVAWISHDQLTCKDRYGPLPVQSLNPLGFKHTKLYTHPMPPPDVRELVEALEEIRRWGTLGVALGVAGNKAVDIANAALAKFGEKS